MVSRPCTSRMETSQDSRTLISIGSRSIMSVGLLFSFEHGKAAPHYTLTLAVRRSGDVLFRLTPAASQPSAPRNRGIRRAGARRIAGPAHLQEELRRIRVDTLPKRG